VTSFFKTTSFCQIFLDAARLFFPIWGAQPKNLIGYRDGLKKVSCEAHRKLMPSKPQPFHSEGLVKVLFGTPLETTGLALPRR